MYVCVGVYVCMYVCMCVCLVCYLHREIILKISTIFGLAGFIFIASLSLPLFLKFFLLKRFCYTGVDEVISWVSGEMGRF